LAIGDQIFFLNFREISDVGNRQFFFKGTGFLSHVFHMLPSDLKA
jgi:hypothetical protein